jgi:hypothetical protein
MDDAIKNNNIAIWLISEHGTSAVGVVTANVNDCESVGDHECARTWSAVGKAVTGLLGPFATRDTAAGWRR